MSELIPVNIVIADRSYRLKIEPVDEEVVRKTVRLINEKIIEFKTSFAGKDMQDYVSMVLVWMATEQSKSSEHLIQMQNACEMIVQMEGKIDKVLNTEES
ncbi:cell division protein ZapA [Chitinophagaceae bacterium LWZ2-11]